VSSPNNPILSLRDATPTLVVEGLAVPAAPNFTADQTLPAGTVFALAVFSAAPGDLTVRHDADADRVEFRASAVDYRYPCDGGLVHPPTAAAQLAFRSTVAVNVTLWAWVAPTTA